MVSKAFKHVKVTGIGSVVPENEINIYDEVKYYDNSVKKVDRLRKMVGFYKRRVCDYETSPADLAIEAAKNLIEDMNIDKNSIDALVYVVQLPDVVAPATAYYIHKQLGLSEDCIATDINQGCVGWVYGLYMVSQMIESKTHKRVLLLNADTPSIGINIDNRNVAPIFGDAGCATLVEYSEKEIDSYYSIKTKSDGFEAIISQFSGTKFRSDVASDEDWELLSKIRKEEVMMPTGKKVKLVDPYIDGLAVFDFTIKVVPENIKEVLGFAKVNKDDIGALCLHQANKQIVQAVAANAGFDISNEERVPYKCFENFGNNTMCSIPVTIELLDKNIKKDKLLCCAFGNGLVSISSILNFENTFIGSVKDYKCSGGGESSSPSPNVDDKKLRRAQYREKYINYWRKKIKGEI